MQQPALIDPTYKLHEGDSEDHKLVIEHTQEIPTSFLDNLADERHVSSQAPTGDFMKLASIPTVIVEKWLRQGFDVHKESAKAIVKRLCDEELTAFLATNKRV